MNLITRTKEYYRNGRSVKIFGTMHFARLLFLFMHDDWLIVVRKLVHVYWYKIWNSIRFIKCCTISLWTIRSKLKGINICTSRLFFYISHKTSVRHMYLPLMTDTDIFYYTSAKISHIEQHCWLKYLIPDTRNINQQETSF